jgi:peptide/nickel transport system permease protein
MARYALKRLGAVIGVLVVMSVLVFGATHALPSNTAQLILGQYSTPETKTALEHKLGLDQPLYLQYCHWASGVLRGDLGQSMVMERPVAPVMWEAFGRSAVLAVSAMIVVSVLGPALR